MDTLTEVVTRTCPRCKETKSIADFGVWGSYMGKRAGTPRTYCRECEKLNSQDSYKKRKRVRLVESVGNPVLQEALRSNLTSSGKLLGYGAAPDGQYLSIYQRDDGTFKLVAERD